jgi:hypothetical protein
MEKSTGTGPVLLCRGRACHSGQAVPVRCRYRDAEASAVLHQSSDNVQRKIVFFV